MSRCVKIVFSVVVFLAGVLPFSQARPAESQAPLGSPVAFVYVSSNSGNNSYQINAFAASAGGRLTPVPGSPFRADVQGMALNGEYLFGTNGVDIYSFSIASDGSLQQVSSVNAQQYNGSNCGGPVALFLDHSGATLYDEDVYGSDCANNAYQFFRINKATGALTYLGITRDANEEFWIPLSFSGNNQYAYGSYCYHFNASLFGFKRNADGVLSSLKITPPMPVAQNGNGYCPYLATADPSNHLAISVQQLNGYWQPMGPPQLATYTIDSRGNLTTDSTYRNMPTASVRAITDIWMSPSGKLLAASGTGGLQVFHFNGSKPVTHYTGLLTRDRVDQFFWDNSDHLYAISGTAGRLYVFTVTPTGYMQAPGSPYEIPDPQNIIVLPKR